ncbi:MAG: NUDIX hydrolase [Candidatus Jacksonbacteria bacterium]|jgi:8-oxo-dGTP diphosphatase|nr:NUDIX hydrolase [Candidatus Jacksonbacteria bacterium]MBT6034000.1 NUDIX hydrolase [Candidatus Jacksonbacteria bacterium]MBT6301549.1 NUDIX hydrolase [Candidatus Jacksonbacteria bacterium]MBT6757480.1 NUDIX hydrolase [Candidatus Jacksonbacteria bacterium]MBT6955407.1 NUDIX hydrolase [Candidatus Jacksonbacteria bacterium]
MKKLVPLTNIDPTQPVLAFLSLKVVVRDKNKVLFLVDANPESGFDLPGGRINSNEWGDNFQSVIEREVVEELGENFKVKINPKPQHIGIHSRAGRFFEDNTPSRTFYAIYEAEYKNGEIKLSDEHSGHEWIDVHQIVIKDKMLSKNFGESLQDYFDSL